MTDIADILAKAKPVTRSVQLCLRGDLVAEKERAERELAKARSEDERHNRPAEAPKIAARIREIEEQIDAEATEFVVQAVGRRVWEKLIVDNPPGEYEKEQGLDFGPGFITASIAASSVSPKMTVEEVSQLEEVLSTSQLRELFSVVMAVNTGPDRLPKSVVAYAMEAASEPKSTTARRGASRGASS